MVPSGQYVACGSAVGWPYGCWAGAARGLRSGSRRPCLASAMALEAAAGMCASRLTGRRPAFGARHGVLARCASPASVRGGQRASGLGDHAPGRGRAGPSLSRPVRRVPYGHCGTMKGGSARSRASKIWPSRGSLIRHAPRCSGNMSSGLGRGAGWGLRPARLTVTSVGLAPGQVHVSNMTASLLLCATNQARIVHHHLVAECNQLR